MVNNFLKAFIFSVYFFAAFGSIVSENKMPIEYLLLTKEELKQKLIKDNENLLLELVPKGLASFELGADIHNKSNISFKEAFSTCRPCFNQGSKYLFMQNAYTTITRFNIGYKSRTIIDLKEKISSMYQGEKYLTVIFDNEIALFFNDGRRIFKSLTFNKDKNINVDSLSFSPDSNYFAITSNKILYIFDIKKNEIDDYDLKDFHQSNIKCIYGEYIITYCVDNFCIWDPNELKLLCTKTTKDISGDRSNLIDVHLSNNNKYLITVFTEASFTKLIVWDISDICNIKSLKMFTKWGDIQPIKTIISNDSKYLIGAGSGNIFVWNIEKLKYDNDHCHRPISTDFNDENRLLPSHVYNISLSKDDKYLAINNYLYNFSNLWIMNDLTIEELVSIITLVSTNDIAKTHEVYPNIKKILNELRLGTTSANFLRSKIKLYIIKKLVGERVSPLVLINQIADYVQDEKLETLNALLNKNDHYF